MTDSNTYLHASKVTIKRLAVYLRCLKEKRSDGENNISSSTLAQGLDLNAVLVRKDLAFVSSVAGKPKTGFHIVELIKDIEKFLGYDNVTDAVLIGVGHLGKALLSYAGFEGCGLNIVAAFDVEPDVVGLEFCGKKIFHIDKLEALAQRLKVNIGIITVPQEYAQGVCDKLIKAGVKAIWNFAPVYLKTPHDVAVKNEDLSASFSVLSKQLAVTLQNNE